MSKNRTLRTPFRGQNGIRAVNRACSFRAAGQRVDPILLYVREELQDVHHEQHRGPAGRQTGEPPSVLMTGFLCLFLLLIALIAIATAGDDDGS